MQRLRHFWSRPSVPLRLSQTVYRLEDQSIRFYTFGTVVREQFHAGLDARVWPLENSVWLS